MTRDGPAGFAEAHRRIPTDYKVRARALDRYVARQRVSGLTSNGEGASRRFNALEISVLTHIATNADSQFRKCWCGPECLANELNGTVRSIQRAIANLELAGAIARVRAKGTQRGEWWYVPVLDDEDLLPAAGRSEGEREAQRLRRRLRCAAKAAENAQPDLLADLPRSTANVAADPPRSTANVAADPSPPLYTSHQSQVPTGHTPDASPFAEGAGDWLIPFSGTDTAGLTEASQTAAIRQTLPAELQAVDRLRFTPKTLAKIRSMCVDVEGLIVTYMQKTHGGKGIERPNAYLLAMAYEQAAERDGVPVESVRQLAKARTHAERKAVMAGEVGVKPGPPEWTKRSQVNQDRSVLARISAR